MDPAEWRDEHPETSEGEGYALSEEQQGEENRTAPPLLDRYDKETYKE